ncbi:hypothetical protein SNEBB_004000 [Seison nebaliae]|nr:hypothetical protein SNEBB_004000 [Seison nebaliae]
MSNHQVANSTSDLSNKVEDIENNSIESFIKLLPNEHPIDNLEAIPNADHLIQKYRTKIENSFNEVIQRQNEQLDLNCVEYETLTEKFNEQKIEKDLLEENFTQLSKKFDNCAQDYSDMKECFMKCHKESGTLKEANRKLLDEFIEVEKLVTKLMEKNNDLVNLKEENELQIKQTEMKIMELEEKLKISLRNYEKLENEFIDMKEELEIKKNENNHLKSLLSIINLRRSNDTDTTYTSVYSNSTRNCHEISHSKLSDLQIVSLDDSEGKSLFSETSDKLHDVLLKLNELQKKYDLINIENCSLRKKLKFPNREERINFLESSRISDNNGNMCSDSALVSTHDHSIPQSTIQNASSFVEENNVHLLPEMFSSIDKIMDLFEETKEMLHDLKFNVNHDSTNEEMLIKVDPRIYNDLSYSDIEDSQVGKYESGKLHKEDRTIMEEYEVESNCNVLKKNENYLESKLKENCDLNDENDPLDWKQFDLFEIAI